MLTKNTNINTNINTISNQLLNQSSNQPLNQPSILTDLEKNLLKAQKMLNRRKIRLNQLITEHQTITDERILYIHNIDIEVCMKGIADNEVKINNLQKEIENKSIQLNYENHNQQIN